MNKTAEEKNRLDKLPEKTYQVITNILKFIDKQDEDVSDRNNKNQA